MGRGALARSDRLRWRARTVDGFRRGIGRGQAGRSIAAVVGLRVRERAQSLSDVRGIGRAWIRTVAQCAVGTASDQVPVIPWAGTTLSQSDGLSWARNTAVIRFDRAVVVVRGSETFAGLGRPTVALDEGEPTGACGRTTNQHCAAQDRGLTLGRTLTVSLFLDLFACTIVCDPQDMKDWARTAGTVTFADLDRNQPGVGYVAPSVSLTQPRTTR